MMNPVKPFLHFGFLSLIVLITICAGPAIAQEVDDQKEFDYVKGSPKGPDQWGYLHPEWAACKNGDEQSPIDLLNKRVKIVRKLGDSKMNYRPSNATLVNRGHDISLQWNGDAGSLQINGTDYVFKQLHWHSPSEHTINGKRFALELHMVHQNTDPVLGNRTAVMGVMYNIGRPQEFLSELEEQIKLITDSQAQVNVGMVDPRHIKITGKKYYRYIGSLTTPPCTEGVTWIINRKVRSVSIKQVKLLRTAVNDSAENNARPLQPLNNRHIFLYSTKHGWGE